MLKCMVVQDINSLYITGCALITRNDICKLVFFSCRRNAWTGLGACDVVGVLCALYTRHKSTRYYRLSVVRLVLLPSFASQSSPFLLPSHLLGGCCCILVCAGGSCNTIVFNFRPGTVIAHRVPTPTHHPALTVNQPRSPWLRYPLPGCTWVICLGMVSISLLRNYLR